VVAAGALFHFAVGHGNALVLPHVLDPGLYQERLDVAARVTGVAQQIPSEGAVTQPDAPHVTHGPREVLGARRIDAVLDGDQDRTAIALGLSGHHRRRPVPRRRQVRRLAARQTEA